MLGSPLLTMPPNALTSNVFSSKTSKTGAFGHPSALVSISSASNSLPTWNRVDQNIKLQFDKKIDIDIIVCSQFSEPPSNPRGGCTAEDPPPPPQEIRTAPPPPPPPQEINKLSNSPPPPPPQDRYPRLIPEEFPI